MIEGHQEPIRGGGLSHDPSPIGLLGDGGHKIGQRLKWWDKVASDLAQSNSKWGQSDIGKAGDVSEGPSVASERRFGMKGMAGIPDGGG